MRSEEILYGKTAPRESKPSPASSIALDNVETYALHHIEQSSIAEVRALIEEKFDLDPGEAVETMRSLRRKGLTGRKNYGDYFLTTLGKEKLS